MVKVIRKQVKPPVEKVVVELTPDQAKIIYAVFGSLFGDTKCGLRVASDSVYELFSEIFSDLRSDPFLNPPTLRPVSVDKLDLKFKD